MATEHPEVVEYLRDRLDAGNTFVKTHHVAAEVGHESRSVVGRWLGDLEERGILEVWTAGGKGGSTYRIVADELDVDDDERIERHITEREWTGPECFDGKPGGEAE